MAIGVVITGIASVVMRGPLLATDSRPATDPDAVDPIVAALGVDRPTRSEPDVPARPTPALADVVPEDPERAGPSDPTDRD